MVRVRFAPSPTGKLHLGSLRTALYNWLYARHSNGKFILRIEDTDLARSKEEYLISIIEDLKWLGIDYDEFYRQSERFDIYISYAEKLVSEGFAYYCTCTREDVLKRAGMKNQEEVYKYDGHCRGRTDKPSSPYVIRFRVQENMELSFFDLVKKELRINSNDLDDFIIVKQDKTATYNFAVVVDDAEMGITHIIRGEDHITNTFKQILVYKALGFKLPQFAHLPLVLDLNKRPLSKREGSIDVEYYRNKGILPEALINGVARLGWGYKDQEVFTVKELIEKFDISGLNRANAIYDEDKIVFLNSKHMKIQDIELLNKHFMEFISSAGLPQPDKFADKKWLRNAISYLRNRHSTLKSLYDEILMFALPEVTYSKTILEEMEALLSQKNINSAYTECGKLLSNIEDFESLPREELENQLKEICLRNEVKFGDLARILRLKLCGTNKSPDIITVIYILGQEVKNRLS